MEDKLAIRNFKNGDIILNTMAGNQNPMRKMIYTGTNGRFIKCIGADNEGSIRELKFYKQDEGILEKIGHSKAYDDYIKELKNLRNLSEE